MAQPENLIIKIRCVHQKYGDFNTEANLDWLVQDLKSHLGEVYPSKPDPALQRLVYAGQLMKDNEKIATYFNRIPEIELPIIHLVYSPNVLDQKIPPEPELRRRKPILTTPNVENTQNSVPNFDSGDATNAQAPLSPPNFGSYGSTNQFYPPNFNQSAPTAGFFQPNQMNPYMNQYFQYLQQLYGPVYWPYGFNSPLGGATGSNFMSFTVPQMFPGTNYGSMPPSANVASPVGQQAAPQNLPQQAPQPAQRDLAMNAQGGVADDDEDGRNRDWLDHVYTAARAALLFIILYSYSSMERLTFVVICCALLYAFQAGWFTRRRPAAAQVQAPAQGNPQPNLNPAAPAPANQNQAPPNPDTPNDQATNQNPTTPVNANAPTNQNEPTPQTAWNVFWSTCYIFISSFFASLIPERPPPVNVN